MQALIYTGTAPIRAEWQERPDLRIQGDLEAIVRPIASAACDLDRRILAGTSPFARKPGFALGHECVAEVQEIGDRVRGCKPGDLVVVPWHISCGACTACRAGHPAQCLKMPGGLATYGVPVSDEWGGLFSDQVRVPYADGMLVPIPAGIDPVSIASASDNLTDAYVAVKRGLTKNPGGRVLVVGGCESLGLFAADHALAMGAQRVDYVDPDAARRIAAQGLGCSTSEALGEEFQRSHEVLVFASRNAEELKPALMALTTNGHCHILSMFFNDQALPMWELYLRDVTLSIGLPNSKPHVPDVLELVRCGHIHPERLVTVHDYRDAPEALYSPDIKPVIVRPRLLSS